MADTRLHLLNGSATADRTSANGTADGPLAQIAREVEAEGVTATYVTKHAEEAEALIELGFDAFHIDDPALGICLPQGDQSHVVLVNVPRLSPDITKTISRLDQLLLPPHWRDVCEFLQWRPGSRPTFDELKQRRGVWLQFVANQRRQQATLDRPVTRERIRFLRPWQLAELPPRSWLWDGILGQGELAMLFGPWGTFKSFLAVGLAIAMADGAPFLGNPTTAGLVLIVCGEGGSGIANRLKAGSAVSRILDRNDSIHDHLGVANTMPALTEPAGFEATCRAIEAMGRTPSLIVLDTFARASAAAALDENSTADMGRLVAALDRLRSRYPGCAVLVVHHSGNERSERARGSSALPSACDVILRVEPIRGPGTPQVKLVVEKLKDGRRPSPIVIDFAEVVVGNDRGRPITSLRVDGYRTDGGEPKSRVDVPGVQTLHAMLRAKGPLPAAPLYRALGIGKSAGIARLNKLVEQGHLRCTKAPKGFGATYDLPEAP